MRSSIKLAAVILLVTAVSITSAQQEEKIKKGIDNLVVALESDNAGLKRSAVYMIYKYNLTELVELVKEEFKNSDDKAFKIFLARTIYKVGSEKEMTFLRTASQNEKDKDVKTMCAVLYNHHLESENLYYANN